MEIISLKPTGFSSNCYIVCSDGEAFVIDPSIREDRIIKELEIRSLALKGILLTHGHFDHIWHAQELRERMGVPLYVHENDAEMLTDSKKNAYSLFTGGKFVIEKADFLLKDGDEVALGNEKMTVIHTPGHSRGSVCYDTGDSLITGDTIFAEGFGRCDLYGGDIEKLKHSLDLLSKMAQSENRWIYCGHGEASTLRAATDMLRYYF